LNGDLVVGRAFRYQAQNLHLAIGEGCGVVGCVSLIFTERRWLGHVCGFLSAPWRFACSTGNTAGITACWACSPSHPWDGIERIELGICCCLFSFPGNKIRRTTTTDQIRPFRLIGETERAVRLAYETDDVDLTVGGIWHGQRDPTQFKVKSRINCQGRPMPL
jgi:hypothetical protein